jgi:hypothetical protein
MISGAKSQIARFAIEQFLQKTDAMLTFYLHNFAKRSLLTTLPLVQISCLLTYKA